jgi:hypothetical protein
MLAFTTAQRHGFTLTDVDLADQREHLLRFLNLNRERFLKGQGTGGQVATAGQALWMLEEAGQMPNEDTAAVVTYLLLIHKDNDAWRSGTNRPPSQGSLFTTNYFAARGLRAFGTPDDKPRITKRLESVQAWALRTKTKDTEDRVFRLRLLKLGNASAEQIEEAQRELLDHQRPDGGWSQLDGGESDAYATGSALVALHEDAGLATDDARYRAGLRFLIGNQQDDGTWHVRTRAKPIQPYFESGFPHGKDQFISIAASAWATTALALATPMPRAQRSSGRSGFGGGMASGKHLQRPQSPPLTDRGHSQQLRADEQRHLVAAELHAVASLSRGQRDRRHGHRLSMPQSLRLLGREPQMRQGADSVGQGSHGSTGHGRIALQRDGVLDREPTDPRPSQGRDIATAAEPLAEIAGQGTDVGALATADFD